MTMLDRLGSAFVAALFAASPVAAQSTKRVVPDAVQRYFDLVRPIFSEGTAATRGAAPAALDDVAAAVVECVDADATVVNWPPLISSAASALNPGIDMGSLPPSKEIALTRSNHRCAAKMMKRQVADIALESPGETVRRAIRASSRTRLFAIHQAADVREGRTAVARIGCAESPTPDPKLRDDRRGLAERRRREGSVPD